MDVIYWRMMFEAIDWILLKNLFDWILLKNSFDASEEFTFSAFYPFYLLHFAQNLKSRINSFYTYFVIPCFVTRFVFPLNTLRMIKVYFFVTHTLQGIREKIMQRKSDFVRYKFTIIVNKTYIKYYKWSPGFWMPFISANLDVAIRRYRDFSKKVKHQLCHFSMNRTK